MHVLELPFLTNELIASSNPERPVPTSSQAFPRETQVSLVSALHRPHLYLTCGPTWRVFWAHETWPRAIPFSLLQPRDAPRFMLKQASCLLAYLHTHRDNGVSGSHRGDESRSDSRRRQEDHFLQAAVHHLLLHTPHLTAFKTHTHLPSTSPIS